MIARFFAKRSPKLPAVELVSVHIPKAAGTTFSHILAQQYPQALYMDYADTPIFPGALGQDPASWRLEDARKAAQLPPHIKVIHGHFWAGKYDVIFPRAKKIVWLRDPVRRLVSKYYYFRSKASLPHPNVIHRMVHEQNLSLIEFARLPGMQNFLARGWLKDVPLSAFDFVGIQEHFAEDVALLGQSLCWRAVTVPMKNRTLHPEYELTNIDPTILQEIQSLNAADLSLYHHALDLRQRRRWSLKIWKMYFEAAMWKLIRPRPLPVQRGHRRHNAPSA